MASALTRFKLVFFVPATSTQQVLGKLFAKYPSELGQIGQYEQCAFITRGTGKFCSLSLCGICVHIILSETEHGAIE